VLACVRTGLAVSLIEIKLRNNLNLTGLCLGLVAKNYVVLDKSWPCLNNPIHQIKHSKIFLGGKNNKRKGAAADEFDDSANFVGVRDRVKGGGSGKGAQGGNKHKKFKKGRN
jgi:hypothetical protein